MHSQENKLVMVSDLDMSQNALFFGPTIFILSPTMLAEGQNLVSAVYSIQLLLFLRRYLLVTINLQTSYDSGILRQDYEIIRGLSMNHKKIGQLVII